MKPIVCLLSIIAVALCSTADVYAQSAEKGFAAITVADLARSEEWYRTHLGTTRLSYSRSGSGHVENVMVGNEYITIELIHFAAPAATDTSIHSTRDVGLQKVGVWVDADAFDAIHQRLTTSRAQFIGGVITDSRLNARSMLVRDDAGVIIQFFARLPGPPAAPQPLVAAAAGAFFALSVADLDASAKWYADKLGMAVTMDTHFEQTRVRVLEGGGLIVELIERPGAVPASRAVPAVTSDVNAVHGFTKAGVIVQDWDRLIARLRGRDVEIAMGPFPARAGVRANVIVKDNSGNLLQFFGPASAPGN